MKEFDFSFLYVVLISIYLGLIVISLIAQDYLLALSQFTVILLCLDILILRIKAGDR